MRPRAYAGGRERQAAKGVWDDDDPKYCALSGHCFYNVTSFTLSNLGATKTCDALMAYINGFSVNAREVLQRFEMRQTCEKLDEKGMLSTRCAHASRASTSGPRRSPTA